MEAVRYQNALLTGRLEQAEAAKTKLTKEVSSLTKIIASIKLQNDDLLNQKNMMTDKDENLKNEVKIQRKIMEKTKKEEVEKEKEVERRLKQKKILNVRMNRNEEEEKRYYQLYRKNKK